MSSFDKVIGYDAIKEELIQICDMIHNRQSYEKIGAKFPHGMLLYGEPGLGKTTIVNCFIAESGLKAYTVRRNKGNDDFIGNITETFKKAKENAPSIVFLDDMDKFANEDDKHVDAPEYVAVQSGIDEVKDSEVFVIATANSPQKLPESLTRTGRFDRKIHVHHPTENDAVEIIKYYLSNKKVSKSINMDDFSKMISYSSCAELETIINEAALNAAYKKNEYIEMDNLTDAVLKMQYHSRDLTSDLSLEEMKKIALHESGHLVVAEIIQPGSVGLASLHSKGRDDTRGFIHTCKQFKQMQHNILISLAGKAAVELYFSDPETEGCSSDIKKAAAAIRNGIAENGNKGFSFVNVTDRYSFESMTQQWDHQIEILIQGELHRYFNKARHILLENRQFLENAADRLLEKKILLYSDIQRIKNGIKKNEVRVIKEAV